MLSFYQLQKANNQATSFITLQQLQTYTTQSQKIINEAKKSSPYLEDENWRNFTLNLELGKLSDELDNLTKVIKEADPSAEISFLTFLIEPQIKKLQQLFNQFRSRLDELDDIDKKLISNILNLLESQLIDENKVTTKPLNSTVSSDAQQKIDNLLADVLQRLANSTDFRPRCFISYAWANQEHEDFILEQEQVEFVRNKLDVDLRSAGISTTLDIRDNAKVGSSMPDFMSKAAKIRYHLVIGTPNYAFKNLAPGGFVVKTESYLIYDKFRKTPGQVVRLLLAGEEEEAFPAFLGRSARLFLDCRDSQDYPKELFRLLEKLYEEILESNEIKEFKKTFEQIRAEFFRTQAALMSNTPTTEQSQSSIQKVSTQLGKNKDDNKDKNISFSCWNVPAPVPIFINRVDERTGDDLLKVIYEFIKPTGKPWLPRMCVITGTAGSGKTQLALKFSTEHYEIFQGRVFFIDARKPESIDHFFLNFLIKKLKNIGDNVNLVNKEDKNLHERSPDKIREEIFRILESMDDIVFIFDRVVDKDHIDFLFKNKFHIKHPIIITSVFNKWLDLGRACINLAGGFNDKEKDSVVSNFVLPTMSFSNPLVETSEKEAYTFCSRLGWFPLAIAQGVYGASLGLADYLYRFNTNFISLSKDKDNNLSLYEKTIFSAWEVTIENLEKKRDAKKIEPREVMSIISFFSPDFIPARIFLNGNEGEEDNNEQVSEGNRFHSTLAELIRWSLLSTVCTMEFGNCFQMYKILQKVTRAKTLESSEAQSYFEKAIKYLVEIFPWALGKSSDYQLAKLLKLHYLVISNVEKLFENDSLTKDQKINRARLCSCLGEAYSCSYDFNKKAEYILRGLVFLESIELKEGDFSLLRVKTDLLLNLAIAYYGVCNYKEQLRALDNFFEIQKNYKFKSKFGEIAKLNFARAQLGLRNPDKALQHLDKDAAYGDDEIMKIAVLGEFCYAHAQQKKFTNSVQKAINEIEAFFSKNDRSNTRFHAMCLRNIGRAYTYKTDGGAKQAIEFLVSALTIQEKLGSENSPAIALTKSALSVAYRHNGFFDQAREAASNSLIIMKSNKFSDDHPDYVETKKELEKIDQISLIP